VRPPARLAQGQPDGGRHPVALTDLKTVIELLEEAEVPEATRRHVNALDAVLSRADSALDEMMQRRLTRGVGWLDDVPPEERAGLERQARQWEQSAATLAEELAEVDAHQSAPSLDEPARDALVRAWRTFGRIRVLRTQLRERDQQ
jgi:hypothetical protein